MRPNRTDMKPEIIIISLIVILIFAMVSCPSKAQDRESVNPDGENVSIHFSPYITDMSISGPGSDYNSDGAFSFNILLKVPLESQLTASIFYNSESAEFKGWSSQGALKVDKQNYGLTLSFYFK